MNDEWDDDFLEEDDEALVATTENKPWRMLIVDDEPDIHDVTKLALRRFSFEGKGIEFISVFSGEEAIAVLQKEKDIALILLDVVMENDHAGLECARRIREELNLFSTRIVLRTGQPGVAPEEEVILSFDINDYRAKTELTAERLFTTVVSALRSYRDILALNEYRQDAYHLLRQNLSSMQAWIDLLEVPSLQLDQENVILIANQCFAKLFDKTPADLVGVSLEELQLNQLASICKEKAEKFERVSIASREWGGKISYTADCANILFDQEG